MKDIGPLSYFLGLKVTRIKDGIFVSQTKYVTDLLNKIGMDTLRACNSPCFPHYQTTKDQGVPHKDPTMYRSINAKHLLCIGALMQSTYNIVGALQYLTFTRPDIAYVVNTICQFMTSPTDVHFAATKRIL
jgi:hypothetical protein